MLRASSKPNRLRFTGAAWRRSWICCDIRKRKPMMKGLRCTSKCKVHAVASSRSSCSGWYSSFSIAFLNVEPTSFRHANDNCVMVAFPANGNKHLKKTYISPKSASLQPHLPQLHPPHHTSTLSLCVVQRKQSTISEPVGCSRHCCVWQSGRTTIASAISCQARRRSSKNVAYFCTSTSKQDWSSFWIPLWDYFGWSHICSLTLSHTGWDMLYITLPPPTMKSSQRNTGNSPWSSGIEHSQVPRTVKWRDMIWNSWN